MPHRKDGLPMVRWNNKEADAVCVRLAVDHIRIAAPISERRVHELATMEGQEWRPRLKNSCWPCTFKKFVEKNRPKIEKLVEDLRAQGLGNAAEDPKTQAQLQQEQDAAASTIEPQLPPEVPEPEPVEAAPLSIGQQLDMAIQRMVDDALAKQAKTVMEHLDALFRGIPGYSRPYIRKTEADLSPGEKLAQVIVVGALPEQVQAVQKAFPNVDVRGYKDRIPGETDPDLVVLMTKFNSHSTDAALKKKYGDKFCRVNGAASNIKTVIASKLNLQQGINGQVH